jgi:hypothetical protein
MPQLDEEQKQFFRDFYKEKEKRQNMPRSEKLAIELAKVKKRWGIEDKEEPVSGVIIY